jgi:D-alanine-D-alanine ligase
VEVPVITVNGAPVIMPMLMFEQADPSHLRTYYEKRDLVDRAQKYQLVPFGTEDPLYPQIEALTRQLLKDYQPFDYGRFEFRVNRETGDVQFLEVNLNANLWSEKVYGRSARLAGWSQSDLIETILCEGLARHGLLDAQGS